MHRTTGYDRLSHAERPRAYRVFTRKRLDRIRQLDRLSPAQRTDLAALAAVVPFRVNNYVLDELIDWSALPDDPMYQLTFPQPDMLAPADLAKMRGLVSRGASEAEIVAAARKIQLRMNPHPAGQLELNVPTVGGERLEGIQHKYRETVLFFPAAGQTCHAYCTYCFRWAQFVGIDDLKFAGKQAKTLVSYLSRQPDATSVLFTGGDPLIMKTAILERYVSPLLEPELEHVESIRFGTKAPAYWPHRFVDDPDADDLLRLFERIVRAGKHVAVMAHFSHPRELSTPVAREALRRILRTGAVVRCQAPLIGHVNDSSDVWAEMWRTQVRLGAVPYYMFVERDTGPKHYFEVPLARSLRIFNDAYARVSGLARTVRGPSMSATPGKVLVDGVIEDGGTKRFVLKMLQGRDPRWAGRTFLARFDADATWLDDLRPADGDEFFFEAGLRAMSRAARRTG